MYSYEIDQLLVSKQYFYESFYEFEKEIRSVSPQVKYRCKDTTDDCIVLDVWAEDGYSWVVYIKRQTQF